MSTRIGAHVLADLLAHEAGVAVGGKAVEEDPEGFPVAQVPVHEVADQLADGREVADEGQTRPQRNRQPDQVLAAALENLLASPATLVQTHAGAAITLDLGLEPEEDLGVDRLRAGVAAPEAPRHGRKQEQRQRGNDQNAGQVDEVLRVQHQAEDVELAHAQVEQHGLALTPVEPGQTVEDDLRQPDEDPAPVGETAFDGSGMDGLGGRKQGTARCCRNQ